MRSLMAILVAGVALASCAAPARVAHAAEAPNLMIMGEDADPDTVPRTSPVFARVRDALSNQLSARGFDVYDETAVTLEDAAQTRARRTDAEIIDIARAVERPPIDGLVVISVYASAEERGYTTVIRTRITGRLLQVHTGARLGNFEVRSPDAWRAPPDCDRECLLETVGEYARILANDLGAVLAEKLAHLTGDQGQIETVVASRETDPGGLATAYTIVFDGFAPDEVMVAEEYLVVFQGYAHHRPIYSARRRAEFWYETTSDAARLQRNLHKMMERLGLSARITFSGGTHILEKITFKE